MTIKRAIANLLVSFALISIGFVLGKETGRRETPAGDAAVAPVPGSGHDRVIVYYMHATVRCVTCNELETSILSVLLTDFADELREGRVEWRTADYQTEEALAKRYDVASGCVVVVKVKDDREAEFKRLDDIWTRSGDRARLSEYLSAAVRQFLSGG